MSFKRIPLIIIAVLIMVSTLVVGVNAEWIYPDMSINFGEEADFNVELNEFEYTPEEVLPGGDNNEQIEVGENHLLLIKNIVDHITYGLNATSKPIVRELLEDGVAVVYSNQNVSGGNLKHMLIDDSSMDRLDFAVKYETDTLYSTFTFASMYLYDSYVGQTIDVYKTDMVYENGKWVAKRSSKGTVKVANVKGGNKQIINIDVYSWAEQKSTTTTSN